MKIEIVVSPNASRTEVIGWVGSALKIKLAAPPVDGKANEELVRFLAKQFGVAKSTIVIEQGMTSRRKVVEVPITEAELNEWVMA